jgi:hypothetical protein
LEALIPIVTIPEGIKIGMGEELQNKAGFGWGRRGTTRDGRFRIIQL